MLPLLAVYALLHIPNDFGGFSTSLSGLWRWSLLYTYYTTNYLRHEIVTRINTDTSRGILFLFSGFDRFLRKL